MNDPSRKHPSVDAAMQADEDPQETIARLERRVAQLERSEARYRSLVEHAPDALVIVGSDGRIVYANRQVETLLGYARSELEGQPVETLVPEAARAAHRGHRRRFAASPRSRAMGEGMDLSAARKDGTVVPVEISLGPLPGEDGLVVLCAIRDVTERRAQQAELRHLNATLEARVRERTAELERSNEELEQFAYVASHDLQEPLRMVASYVRLLEQQYRGKLDADAEEFIGYAVEGATRMQQQIKDLLRLSRIGTRGGVFAPMQASDALRDALRNLEMTIAESGAVVTFDDLPSVHADRPQIALLFQNLVANAVKFQGDEAPRVHVGVQRHEGAWCFSVGDEGIGIEEAFRERVFVIFQRLHSRDRYPGTGIGLAICRKIVERHGGRIWVESNEPKGSVFKFTLADRPEGAR